VCYDLHLYVDSVLHHQLHRGYAEGKVRTKRYVVLTSTLELDLESLDSQYARGFITAAEYLDQSARMDFRLALAREEFRTCPAL